MRWSEKDSGELASTPRSRDQFIRNARSCTSTFALGLLFALLLLGCTPIPLGEEKPITFAEAPPMTSQLQSAAERVNRSQPPSFSSYMLLNNGHEALGARLRMIEAAEHTLDLQYFLMKPDLSGALVIQALLAAADRGVRVRLLLDDVFTPVTDEQLGLVNAHPNISIRIFNPVIRQGPKALGFLTEFSRVNRRMHNKSMTADAAFAIVGGRNIADEYYQIDTTTTFADFDMLLTGAVLPEISESFDVYWNDSWSVPMERLRTAPTATQLAEARETLDASLAPAQETYDEAVNDPYFERLRTGDAPIFHGPAVVVADTPEKLRSPVQDGERILADALIQRMTDAQEEVILLTPYFVPEDYGAEVFLDLAKRGVNVSIVTNSLASTNHPYVHAGYRRHRLPLLAAGVRLYEIRADALQTLGLVPQDDPTKIVMHTKMAVIDGEQVFVGSLNFDPRSIKLNSEFGLFIESEPLSERIHARLAEGLPDYTYRLSRGTDDALIWNYDNAAAPTQTQQEPGATIFKNVVVGITELLNIELQL